MISLSSLYITGFNPRGCGGRWYTRSEPSDGLTLTRSWTRTGLRGISMSGGFDILKDTTGEGDGIVGDYLRRYERSQFGFKRCI